MEVKLFSLCKQEVPETEAGKKNIFECVKNFFPDCEGFSAFTSQKRMLLAISQSLRAADIVIVAVQNNMYNATKRLLSAALDLKIVRNTEATTALNPLLETGKIKQNVFDANVRFPAGAEILPTESFLNCGFALASGGQHIIYLPIEAPRADEVVYGSLYDYLAIICKDEKIAVSFNGRHKKVILRLAEKLDADSVKITFSGEILTNHIAKYLQGLTAKACFILDEAKSYKDLTKEEFIEKARDLREENYSQLGVVITDISYDEESAERYVEVAVADENGTVTMKISAEKDESDEEFISACIDKLMLTLYHYEKLSDTYDEANLVTNADKSLRNNLFKIASGVIGASAIISLIIALIMK